MTLHLTVGLKGVNNEFNYIDCFNILRGVGELEFPQALKRDLLMSSIYCQSLYLSENSSATDEGLLLVCNGSYYITQNGMAKQNVLALFHNQAKSHITHFTDYRFPSICHKTD